MGKRKIRTRDQLPRAATREEKIAAKQQKIAAKKREFLEAPLHIGIDVGNEGTAMALGVVERDCRVVISPLMMANLRRAIGDQMAERITINNEPLQSFFGVNLIVNPNMSDDEAYLCPNHLTYDFRKRHGD